MMSGTFRKIKNLLRIFGYLLVFSGILMLLTGIE